jgi:hypothetical protein
LDEQARPVPILHRDHCEVLNLDLSRIIEAVDSAGIGGNLPAPQAERAGREDAITRMSERSRRVLYSSRASQTVQK